LQSRCNPALSAACNASVSHALVFDRFSALS
jgi:hypothetical protein